MSDSGLRALLASLLLPVAALLCPGIARLACAQEDTAPQVVASCDFEGPYSQGDQQIQEGCVNNWQWGRKDMVLTADADSGRPGTAQRIHVRGIASGGVQFFFTRLALKAGMYYRVSYWMKADGLEGSVRCHVRKIGYPWTEYLVGPSVTPGAQWRQYSFSGKCSEDVTSDVGVCWDSGSLGTTWLDDLTLEQSDSPFPSDAPALQAPPESGNLLPRSSCEGRRDHMWSMLFFGAARGGRWEGVEADWEDPQMFRAEGGKVGGYCMAVPSAAHAGQGAAITTPFTLLSGKPYTVSAWMRADVEDYPGSIALLHYLGPRHHQGMAGAYPRLTTQWQRVSFVATPKPPVETPGEDQTAAPLEAVLQVAPSATIHGTVYVDGLQIEAGEVATDYRPAFPFELYADIGQDGGNLLQWGEPLSLRLLAAAADNSELRVLPVEVTITAYPDTVVWRQALSLRIGEETTLTPDLGRRGLFRVDLRAVDPTLAAPQQMVFASVPPPRETGTRGMFGTHIAIRPLLVSYIRRLGFTWTRLHDCSLLTKWSATEPRPGEYLWHDEVAQGVVRGGLHILGLPDHEPEWARVTTEGANPVDAEAYARYCEQVARHYAGTIDHWELWNEPYMGGFYSGGAASFGELMQAGYPALKRGNPRATVLGWCADISNPAWGAALSDAARACIDVFSFHNYINSVPGGGTLPFAGELPDHRKQWPPQVNECWNTEGTNADVCANSLYTVPPLCDPDRNARATAFASRVWVEHARAGVSKYFVYTMHNTDTMMYNGGYQSLLIGYDRTPTPAAVATAVTAYCIDGLRFLQCPGSDGVVQAAFGGDGRAAWVVYDDAGVMGRRRLNLAALPEGVGALDVTGNDPRSDGTTEWEIGMNPLFVLSQSLDAQALAEICARLIE